MENRSLILTEIYELNKQMIGILSKFPRDQRFLLANRIQTILMDLLEKYLEAYYHPHSAEKRRLLQQANLALEKLRYFIRLSYELKFVTSGTYAVISEKILLIGRMTGGWLKSLPT